MHLQLGSETIHDDVEKVSSLNHERANKCVFLVPVRQMIFCCVL